MAQIRVEQERTAVQAAEAARQARPCADCGAQRSAGLCEACGYQRETQAMLEEIVLIAAAGSADIDDSDYVAAMVSLVVVYGISGWECAGVCPGRTSTGEDRSLNRRWAIA
ncbi:hypothetical protein [Streptomyces sp. R41]|uniref:Uncharacterized protein n=1 Tax=Streptomyces sp. R41 TaxID=3238632 RepID=A0AB39R5D6_9ACTN